jgi:DNA-binding NarL/FixJ family response regulator
MGRIPTGNRKDGLKRLSNVHRAILRRLAQGQRRGEVAEALGVSVKTVTRASCCALGMQELERLHAERDKEAANFAASSGLILDAQRFTGQR